MLKKMPIIKFSPGSKMGPSNNLYDFHSPDNYNNWYKSTLAELGELDEYMNLCKYFVRVKGNEGNYVREGKSFPVDGSWVGIQDFDNYPPCQPFVKWLEDNGWREDWFCLMDKYVEHQSLSYKKPIKVC